MPLTGSFYFYRRQSCTHGERGLPIDARRQTGGFPVEHALLGDFEQVAAVLGQQVERVGDVRDVFDVAVA